MNYLAITVIFDVMERVSLETCIMRYIGTEGQTESITFARKIIIIIVLR